METVRGVIAKLKGAGYWVVRGTDLHSYALMGGDKELRQEGLEVEITGEVKRTSIGLGGSSGVLEIKSYRVLSKPGAANGGGG
jgi:hypothetical protein